MSTTRQSTELDRAREIRPLIDTVDVLFDLHSMLWPSDPLILCGTSAKGRTLALGAGVPDLVVADHGHASGKRLIDYPRFAEPDTPYAASLVEAGQHWDTSTVDTMLDSVAGLFRHLDMTITNPVLPPPPTAASPRFAMPSSSSSADPPQNRSMMFFTAPPTPSESDAA